MKPPKIGEKINETKTRKKLLGSYLKLFMFQALKNCKTSTLDKNVKINARRQNNARFLFESQYPMPSFRVILKAILEKSQCQKLTASGKYLPSVGFSGIQIPFFGFKITI